MSFQQYFSYGFTTVENPLSDGGNFAQMSTMNQLKVFSSGVCELSATTLSGNFYTGVLPNEQYVEATINAFTGLMFLVVRGAVGASNSYVLQISTTQIVLGVGTITTGLSVASFVNGTITTTAAVGDKWRFAVSGNDAIGGGAWLTATRFPVGGGPPISFSVQDTVDQGPSNGGGQAGLILFATAVGNMQVSSFAAGGPTLASAGNFNKVLTH